MESPVTQARLQADFLRRLMAENDGRLLDRQLGGLAPQHFNHHWPIDIFVAISDQGQISRGMEVPELLKADQAAGAARAIVKKRQHGRRSLNPINYDAIYFLSDVEIGRLRGFLLSSHTPLRAGRTATPPPWEQIPAVPSAQPPAPQAGTAVRPETEAHQGPTPDFVQRARETHPNAFRPWTSADDQRLAALFRAGSSVDMLCAEFGRPPKGITMRLERLGLVHPQQGAGYRR